MRPVQNTVEAWLKLLIGLGVAEHMSLRIERGYDPANRASVIDTLVSVDEEAVILLAYDKEQSLVLSKHHVPLLAVELIDYLHQFDGRGSIGGCSNWSLETKEPDAADNPMFPIEEARIEGDTLVLRCSPDGVL